MVLPEEYREMYFPHDDIRPIQEDLIKDIDYAISTQHNLIAHAPTGMGKTAAALGPAIKEAIKKGLTIFFLTSRHTQHQLAFETINLIKEKYKLNITAADMIGKKWFCLQSGVSSIYPREFYDYCNKLKEDRSCEFYENTRDNGEFSKIAYEVAKQLMEDNKTDTNNIIKKSREFKVCPYEIALLIARKAKVIIGDYFYLFSPSIRKNFLRRINKELNEIIIIIDEGHNLPSRVKDLASHRITNNIVKRAREEASKRNEEEIVEALNSIEAKLFLLGENIEDEIYITKEELIKSLEEFDYDELISDMTILSDKIREEQKYSYLGTVASFLEAWNGEDAGFARILSKSINNKGEETIILHYRCLDPSLITRDVIKSAYSTVLMSGTLNPTSMYKSVLGFDSSVEKTYKSPFPEDNKLNIIIPKTSTKYQARSDAQFKQIGEIIAKATNKIPGNSAVFFPSYYLMEQINKTFSTLSEKSVFLEDRKMSKGEKQSFLEKFKGYKNIGAVLLGVISGNFGEGIDLPGDFLKGVIIVGLPLQKPDLETEALIKYYDEKFNKGWDYGYLFPAFNKALQSAGRCIRTETDKGIVIFLDERYTWGNYMRCFPSHWNLKVTLLYESMIERFFGKVEEKERIQEQRVNSNERANKKEGKDQSQEQGLGKFM